MSVRAAVTGIVVLVTVGLLPAHVAMAQPPWRRQRMTTLRGFELTVDS